jgi:hypothetical protein
MSILHGFMNPIFNVNQIQDITPYVPSELLIERRPYYLLKEKC